MRSDAVCRYGCVESRACACAPACLRVHVPAHAIEWVVCSSELTMAVCGSMLVKCKRCNCVAKMNVCVRVWFLIAIAYSSYLCRARLTEMSQAQRDTLAWGQDTSTCFASVT